MNLRLFLLPLLFFAACATTPVPRPALSTGDGGALENDDIGFRGYRLPLERGYALLSAEQVAANPLISDWPAEQAASRKKIGGVRVLEEGILRNRFRYIYFSVQEYYTPVPFSRMAPDRRERFFRLIAQSTEHRIERVGGKLLSSLRIEQIHGKNVARTDLREFPRGFMKERVNYTVQGRLNEFYHFWGLAFEGEGHLVEEDIEALIGLLEF